MKLWTQSFPNIVFLTFPIRSNTSNVFSNIFHDSVEVCTLFFTKLSETGEGITYQCSCGTQRKQRTGSGYTILLEPFVIDSGNEIVEVEGETIIARAMKRKRPISKMRITLMTCIPPSNVCERFFSAARYFSTQYKYTIVFSEPLFA